MVATPYPIPQLLTLLAAAPSHIVAATADLNATQLRAAPAPEQWSANDVLAHLRACADVWGGCIATILAQDEPTFRAVNPRTWICLLYTSPSPRDRTRSRMPSSA